MFGEKHLLLDVTGGYLLACITYVHRSISWLGGFAEWLPFVARWLDKTNVDLQPLDKTVSLIDQFSMRSVTAGSRPTLTWLDACVDLGSAGPQDGRSPERQGGTAVGRQAGSSGTAPRRRSRRV
jgi:hypothetical protein